MKLRLPDAVGIIITPSSENPDLFKYEYMEKIYPKNGETIEYIKEMIVSTSKMYKILRPESNISLIHGDDWVKVTWENVTREEISDSLINEFSFWKDIKWGEQLLKNKLESLKIKAE